MSQVRVALAVLVPGAPDLVARRRDSLVCPPDPRRVAKPLGAELAGIYSARLGRDWRVLYEIDESKLVVIVLDIRHRSAAYRRR